jgi:hypothetical protein
MQGGRARRSRRARLVFGGLIGAMAAAIALSAVGAVTAGRQSADQAATAGEILGGHPHDARALALQRAQDRRRAKRCATAAGLAAYPAGCPRPTRRLARAARTRLVAQTHAASSASSAGQRAFAAEAAGGLAQLAAIAGPPSAVGEWSAPLDLNANFVAENAIVLPTGKVLLFGPGPPASANTARAVVYDPATGAKTQVDPPIDPRTGSPYNIWCAGHVLLANGTVLVAGGNDDLQNAQDRFQGLRRLFTFNPYNLTWTEQPQMYTGRWYPTVTRLADGRAVILGGWDDVGDTNTYANDLEVFTPHPTDRDGIGTITRRDDGGVNPGLYSQMALLPDGNLLRVGPRVFDPKVLNTTTFRWGGDLPDEDFRYWGAWAITIEGSQRLLRRIGGAGPVDLGQTATQTATGIFNLDNPGGGEQVGPALGTPRAHANAVVLPTGEILAVGGGLGQDANGNNYTGPVFESELFSPVTNTWRPVASQVKQRAYHSVAALLPDGRVLSAGDDKPATAGANLQIGSRGDDTLEFYSPPYLNTGTPRPTISAAPASVGYAQSFVATSPDAASITRAVLIAPAAVTHAADMAQRSIRLDFTVAGDSLTLTSPSGPTLAPPGDYMLFLVNSQGVPTVARWIFLGQGGPPPPPPPDTTAPAIANRTPAPNATGVAAAADVVVTFNEALNPATVTAARLNIAPAAGGAALAATITPNAGNTVFTLNPSADLDPSVQYRVTVGAGITDTTGNPIAADQQWTFTTAAAGGGGTGAFLFQGGQVAFEAESFDTRTDRASRSWVARTATAGFAGTGYMVTEPDAGAAIAANYPTTSPQLDYAVNFGAPGTYYVWLRAAGPNSGGDSVHVGLDGAAVLTTENFPIGVSTAFAWKNKSGGAQISVPSAGVYTINLWMREDGGSVDRIVVSNSAAFVPTGTGPAESPRG